MNKQNGGLVLGFGSYGTVVSDPRLPYKNENFEEMIMLKDEVSKIFKDNDDYNNEVNGYNLFIDKINDTESFIKPIKHGTIDVQEYVNKKKQHYDIFWSSKKIVFQITDFYDKQITFPKGIKIKNIKFDLFLINFYNIFLGVRKLHQNKYICGDIKFDNLLIHDNKFKIIDYSSIKYIPEISPLEFEIQNILSEPFYFVHPALVCIFIKCYNVYYTEPFKESYKIEYEVTSSFDKDEKKVNYNLLMTCERRLLRLIKKNFLNDNIEIKLSKIYKLHNNKFEKVDSINLTLEDMIYNLFYDKHVEFERRVPIINREYYYSHIVYKFNDLITNLINKYPDLYNKNIILELLYKKIDLYSCAITILNYITNTDIHTTSVVYDKKYANNFILKKYVKLAFLLGSSLIIKKIDNKSNDLSNIEFYFIDCDIQELNHEYKKIICDLIKNNKCFN